MRVLAVAAAWVAATLVVLACALTAYLGTADWGDGQGDSAGPLELAGLTALALGAVAVAVWVTRRASR